MVLKLFADGSVNLNMGAADLGTGTKTVMAMVVSEELGVPFDRISIEHADTATTQFTNPSGGSKTVPTEAPAVREAALAVKRELLSWRPRSSSCRLASFRWQEAARRARRPGEEIAIAAVAGLRRRGVLVGVASRGPIRRAGSSARLPRSSPRWRSTR